MLVEKIEAARIAALAGYPLPISCVSKAPNPLYYDLQVYACLSSVKQLVAESRSQRSNHTINHQSRKRKRTKALTELLNHELAFDVENRAASRHNVVAIKDVQAAVQPDAVLLPLETDETTHDKPKATDHHEDVLTGPETTEMDLGQQQSTSITYLPAGKRTDVHNAPIFNGWVLPIMMTEEKPVLTDPLDRNANETVLLTVGVDLALQQSTFTSDLPVLVQNDVNDLRTTPGLKVHGQENSFEEDIGAQVQCIQEKEFALEEENTQTKVYLNEPAESVGGARDVIEAVESTFSQNEGLSASFNVGTRAKRSRIVNHEIIHQEAGSSDQHVSKNSTAADAGKDPKIPLRAENGTNALLQNVRAEVLLRIQDLFEQDSIPQAQSIEENKVIIREEVTNTGVESHAHQQADIQTVERLHKEMETTHSETPSSASHDESPSAGSNDSMAANIEIEANTTISISTILDTTHQQPEAHLALKPKAVSFPPTQSLPSHILEKPQRKSVRKFFESDDDSEELDDTECSMMGVGKFQTEVLKDHWVLPDSDAILTADPSSGKHGSITIQNQVPPPIKPRVQQTDFPTTLGNITKVSTDSEDEDVDISITDIERFVLEDINIFK
ncbi:hypothetical protein HDV05_008201 [Chytridiales sp. JEL 0842]|nr:hypothetical protein HDV05_008201 [Chytridiales sp. JEL 0842]